jgi:hypothetical protein
MSIAVMTAGARALREYIFDPRIISIQLKTALTDRKTEAVLVEANASAIEQGRGRGASLQAARRRPR